MLRFAGRRGNLHRRPSPHLRVLPQFHTFKTCSRAMRLLPTAYCLLPSAFCTLHSALCTLHSALCPMLLLPTPFCPLLSVICLCAMRLLPPSLLLTPAFCLLPTAYSLGIMAPQPHPPGGEECSARGFLPSASANSQRVSAQSHHSFVVV